MRRWIMIIVGVVISGGLLYYLIRDFDLALMRDELEAARYGYLAPALVLYVVGFWTRAVRWQILLQHRLSLWHSFHIMMAGYMLTLLPLRVGELARAWLTTRVKDQEPLKFFTALSSIVIERILDLLAVLVLLGLALTALPVTDEIQASGLALLVVTLVMTVGIVFVAHYPGVARGALGWGVRVAPVLERFNLREWLEQGLDGLAPIRSFKTGGLAIVWTVLSWATSILAGYLVFAIFFEDVTLAATALTLVMVALVIAVPSVPGNLGPFEAAVVAGVYFGGLIESTQSPDNIPAVALGLLLHVLNIGSYVLFGMWGLYVEQTSVGQVRTGLQGMQQDGDAHPKAHTT